MAGSSAVRRKSTMTSVRLVLAVLIFAVSGRVAAQTTDEGAAVCNICGCEDCIIGFPQGTVRFVTDDGVSRQFPCEQLQQIVANPTIIPTDFWYVLP